MAALGCGDPEDAASSLEGAQAYLFPDVDEDPEGARYAAQLRDQFYPGLRQSDAMRIVTTAAECGRVLRALAEVHPDVVGELRVLGDSLRGGRSFAVLEIGAFYHVTTAQIPPPGYVMLDGGFSYVAPKSTLVFGRVAHMQF